MTFIWPSMLFLLALVPLAVLAYVLLSRRKKRQAARLSSLSFAAQAAGASRPWRRHVPPLLFLIAFAVMLLAIARPVAVMTLPSQQQNIVLAIDVSGSMRATDVAPTRILAAKAAAKQFISEQPRNVRMGIVSYAGTAAAVLPPTDDREALLAAVERLELQSGTAIGSGILVSLKMLIPDVQFNLSSSDPRPLDKGGKARPAQELDSKSAPPAAPAEAAGSYTSGAVILLTDGQNTTGPNPIEAAKMAAERGLQVFTVGIGTTTGESVKVNGWSMTVKLDEESLKEIARLTKAEYFFADNAKALANVYKKLNFRLSFEKKETELSAMFAAAAAAFSLLSAMLSMLWFNRLL